MPPRILMQKVGKKLKNQWKMKKNAWRDVLRPTYEIHFPSPKSLNSYLKKIELKSIDRELILRLCDHYLQHQFDLLGSGSVRVFRENSLKINRTNAAMSQKILSLLPKDFLPIDWQIDFKSGFRWDETFRSEDIEYGNKKGADVKVPWELARMQHLTILGWGYAITSDIKYLQEFQNQIVDFIGSNPPRYGVNWVCTMDVGIRIANWLLAYDLLKAYGAPFDKAFEEIFFRSVYEHGKHIYTHLEWDPYLRSNHYLANIAGLLFVSVYLSENGWFKFCANELEAEVLSQFHADGSNFEASTSYHRLSAEMVVYAVALATEAGCEFSQEFMDRIQKMGNFIRDITKPDGTIPQFGDNDSGRFIKLLPDQNELDHRYLIRAIRKITSLNSVIIAQFSETAEIPKLISAYPDFGLYIQRKDPWFLAFRCGSIGQKGNGGHAHNDQLSFELAVKGVSCIVDPGTYVYTPFPDARRRFRSSIMHNTLVLQGKEQNRDEGLFKMKDLAKARILRCEDGLIIAEHVGFGFTYRRSLRLENGLIEGIDECEGGLKEIYFHFSPDWILKQTSSLNCLCICGSIVLKMHAETGCMELLEGEFSKGYGQKINSPVLVIRSSVNSIGWKLSF